MSFVDDVVDRASRIDWRRVIVWIVAVIPFALGWLVGRTAAGLAVVMSWIGAACKAGYETGRGD